MAAAWQRVAALAVAGLLYISALLHGVEAQCGGGFVNSCREFGYFPTNGVLIAACKLQYYDIYESAAIKLNSYLGNYNGELRPGSNFLASCRITSLVPGSSSAILSASCKTYQGNYIPTSYDLNKRISNINGVLKWHNCRRRALLESDDKVLVNASKPEGGRNVFT